MRQSVFLCLQPSIVDHVRQGLPEASSGTQIKTPRECKLRGVLRVSPERLPSHSEMTLSIKENDQLTVWSVLFFVGIKSFLEQFNDARRLLESICNRLCHIVSVERLNRHFCLFSPGLKILIFQRHLIGSAQDA